MLLELLAVKGFPIAIKFITPHLASWCHSYGIAGAMKLTYATSVGIGGGLWIEEKVKALKDGIKAVEKKDINGIWNAIDQLKDIPNIGDVSSLSKSVENYIAGKGDLKEVLNGFEELYDGVRGLQKNLKSPEQISVENVEFTNSSLENLNNHQSNKINLDKKNEIFDQLKPKQPEINQKEISIAQLDKGIKHESELLLEDNLKFDSDKLILDDDTALFDRELQCDYSL
ncbi:hypothetical protein [Nostoc sp.]|uniref:hypothetical protein n=1 Tax=Nostoc sp. TaxID=1180 RepID=UPI002FF990EB